LVEYLLYYITWLFALCVEIQDLALQWNVTVWAPME